MDGTLVIGTRRYSSWSLRGWLAVRLAGLAVEERVLPLGTPELHDATPAGLVPALRHRGLVLWDSLAIAEYCAEQAPGLWPGDAAARAHARCMAAEMHSGLRALRVAMPMVLGREDYGVLGAALTADPAVAADVLRVEALWRECRGRFGAGGAFLFGAPFTLADAFYAPVVLRFLCYRPALSADTLAYCEAVRLHPLMREWCDLAAGEPEGWRLSRYESLREG